MSAREKLTKKVLEQHDGIHPKLQATHQKAPPSNKEEDSVQQSRAESNTNENNLAGRAARGEQKKTPSKNALSPAIPTTKLSSSNPRDIEGRVSSVFSVVYAAKQFKRLSNRSKTSLHGMKYENTYKLGPDPHEKFKVEIVRELLEKMMNRVFISFTYTNHQAKKITKYLTNEIRARVSLMRFNRYKLVCQVIMMQNRAQGTQVASRCVWSPDTDTFASYTYTSPQVICIANVHAVYFE